MNDNLIWSFDDVHIGKKDVNTLSLLTRVVKRPPNMTHYDWYHHASNICGALNGLTQ